MYDRYGRKVEDASPASPDAADASLPTPLTSPPALYALTYLAGDPVLVDRIVHRYGTWERLAAASNVDLGFTIGSWAAQLQISPTCPPLPELGSGIRVVSRYEDGYPAQLRDLPDAPVLLYHVGDLPKGPLLAVGGTHFPSARALATVRDAVRVAVSQKIPVVAAFDTGCGHAALEEVVERHGRAVAVASGDLDKPASNSVLIRRILDNGGAVVSEWGPNEPWSEARTFDSSRLAAALATGVVVPEVGTHATGGSTIVRTAISLERYLIVPQTPADAELPVNADGLTILSKPRHFSERVFGTNLRIQARIRSRYPAADAVVESKDELAQAVALACSTPGSSSRR